MADGQAGYTGVVYSEYEAGYTGAEGYTGVVRGTIASGYTGAASVPSAPVTTSRSEVDPLLVTPSPYDPAVADRDTAPPISVTPSPYDPVVADRDTAPGAEGADAPVEEASSAAIGESLRESFDALTEEDARLALLREIAEPVPSMSEMSREAIKQIQDKLGAGKDLKRAAVIGPWIVDFASKFRFPGVPSQLAPSVSPGTKIAKQLGPEAAKSVDPIVTERIKDIITFVLIRENELSQDERIYWRNAASLMGIKQ
jgi:hypothetical protein